MEDRKALTGEGNDDRRWIIHDLSSRWGDEW
jgi:hypothetical protein